MINLWYEESYWGHTGGRLSGPEKVVKNTIASLEEQNINFSINKDVYEYNFLMQYQHDVAFRKHEKLEHDSCIIGPQVWLFDSYGKFLIENPNYYNKVIAPSSWVEDLYINKLSLPSNKVSVWAAPIKAPDISDDQSIDCLIYYKNRPIEHLEKVKLFLSTKGFSYIELKYGNYNQKDFKDALSKVKFCIIIDNTESQGIAVQEMMAVGKPLLVWDLKEWDYMGDDYKVFASSVPYWSDNCGEKFYFENEFEFVFQKFYDRLDRYDPKSLYNSQLSYKVSVEKLLEIFNVN